jgi:hypothetical protein
MLETVAALHKFLSMRLVLKTEIKREKGSPAR